jgi:tetratricopeptide repeat protein
LDKAEENLNKSLEISQLEPFVLFLLGNIYSRRGRISEAVDCYETAIFLDFDMYVAHIDFARKYEHMGRHKKALREYKAALEIDSRDEGLLEKINYIEKKCKMTKACDFEKEEQNHLINDQLALNL